MGKLYDIFKASKLGAGAAPDYYTAIIAKSFSRSSAEEYELTDEPPLSYQSNGQAIVNWTIYGNTLQSAPTPLNPIVPQGCGDLVTSGAKAGQYIIPILSANTTTPVYLGEVQTERKIFKYEITGNETFTQSSSPLYYIVTLPKVPLLRNGLYSTHFTAGGSDIAEGACRFAGSGAVPDSRLIFNYDNGAGGIANFKSWIAQQYATGTPVTVWYVLTEPEIGIVNEPLHKIGNYADSISNAASIPTVKGNNTLTIDTDIQPSQMYIKYYK